MGRGGDRKPDGFELYDHPDGRQLKLLKSTKSKTGYYNVVEIRPGAYYPKKKLDDKPNSKKMKTFGTKSDTAIGAAIKLAEYSAAPYELPVAGPRVAYGSRNTVKYLEGKKRRRLDIITAEANKLLGIDPNEPIPEWVADPADPGGPPMVCVEAFEVTDPTAPIVYL